MNVYMYEQKVYIFIISEVPLIAFISLVLYDIL